MDESNSTPVTAQDVERAKMVTTLEDAIGVVKPGKNYDVTSLLQAYLIEFECLIDNKEKFNIRRLTDSKNILMRDLLEKMIEEQGRFNLQDMIPFDHACTACKGTGELYLFFRKTTKVDCKFCDHGKKEIVCPTCKGARSYKVDGKDGKPESVECARCDRGEDGKPTGKATVDCRKCHGSGKFHKLVIDSKIKSTTYCRVCKGRGFLVDEDDPAPAPKVSHERQPSNPVLTVDLAAKIKTAATSQKITPGSV